MSCTSSWNPSFPCQPVLEILLDVFLCGLAVRPLRWQVFAQFSRQLRNNGFRQLVDPLEELTYTLIVLGTFFLRQAVVGVNRWRLFSFVERHFILRAAGRVLQPAPQDVAQPESLVTVVQETFRDFFLAPHPPELPGPRRPRIPRYSLGFGIP